MEYSYQKEVHSEKCLERNQKKMNKEHSNQQMEGNGFKRQQRRSRAGSLKSKQN